MCSSYGQASYQGKPCCQTGSNQVLSLGRWNQGLLRSQPAMDSLKSVGMKASYIGTRTNAATISQRAGFPRTREFQNFWSNHNFLKKLGGLESESIILQMRKLKSGSHVTFPSSHSWLELKSKVRVIHSPALLNYITPPLKEPNPSLFLVPQATHVYYRKIRRIQINTKNIMQR